jgi:hypothetical protein
MDSSFHISDNLAQRKYNTGSERSHSLQEPYKKVKFFHRFFVREKMRHSPLEVTFHTESTVSLLCCPAYLLGARFLSIVGMSDRLA